MKKIKKRGFKGVSALLCLIFAVIIFAGAESMAVKAANVYTIALVNTKSDVELIKQNGVMVPAEAVAYVGNNITPVEGDIVWCWYSTATSEYCYMKYVSGNWTFPECSFADLAGIFSGAPHNYLLGVNNPAIGGSGNVTVDAGHKHSYTWVTSQEITADQDGIEEYKCSCGRVQDRAIIPYTTYIVRGLYDAVKDAPVNGTASYDSMKLYCITDYIIKKMAERSDVTTVVTFEYNGAEYQMTIPAGTDFTSVLEDEDYFYGYFGFAAKVGATVSAL